MVLQESFISVIPLAKAGLEAPFVSNQLVHIIRSNQSQNQKTLLFYNRRGSARAWMCEDCGYFEKCPHCDIAFAYHSQPTKRLVCHQCNAIAPFLLICPHCRGNKILGIGVGIERIAGDLGCILGEKFRILRIDSDSKKKISDMFCAIDTHDVILSTSLGSTLVHPDIASVCFLSFESNLSVPEYDMEEQLYDDILFYKKQGLPIYLQTYIPRHPLIQEILTGNQKSFFSLLQQERRKFSYPPFSDLITIRVHHHSRSNVSHMIAHLVQKIRMIDMADIFVASDKDIWEKRGGEWSQKIILKGKNLSSIIGEIETEVVRNRSVSMEWN